MSERINQIVIYALLIIAFILIINFAINYDYNKTKDQIGVNENIFDKNENVDLNYIEDVNKELGEINMNEYENYPIVVIETSKGNIVLKLNKEKAPITVANFLKYVNNEFYNQTVFHRVIKDFMIQGGGFSYDGSKKETLEPIILESSNGLKNLKGTIAMARTMDPDSATAQFFINVVNNDFLDYTSQSPGYAVFGEVIEGIDVVMIIQDVATKTNNDHQDWPIDDVVINKVYLRE